MAVKQRAWGQYETLPELADLILGFCFRRPTDSLLDPSCGEGMFLRRAARFQRWLAEDSTAGSRPVLWGVDIDPQAVQKARQLLEAESLGAQVVAADFIALEPGQAPGMPPMFDCIVGNPPYTRSEWLEADGLSAREAATRALNPAEGEQTVRWSKRSGLHGYFFLQGLQFLRPGGRFGFVVSNSWLDVQYGAGIKAFLLANFKIIAIVESAVEQWFVNAKVNTCIIIMERSDSAAQRQDHQVRFARLNQPLRHWLVEQDSRPTAVDGLVARILPGKSRPGGDLPVRVIPQKALDPAEKWGPYLRGPDVFFQTRRDERQVPLGQVASLRRGLTTGANDFFYLTPGRIHEWQIDERLTRPLLKSPKEVQRILVAGSDVSHRVLSLNAHSVDDVSTPIGRYVGWGESLGLHQLRTCARRPCWYSLLMAGSDAPQVAVPKGIWRRHAVLLLEAGIEVDQQFYLVQARPEYLPVIAALLTSSWAALQIELFGRRNFGLGVLWLAATDLLGVRLPDPRHIGQDATAQLVEALDKLAAEPLRPLAEQVAEPARQSLDTLVFDLLGLTAADRQATVGAAVNLAEARMQRAASG